MAADRKRIKVAVIGGGLAGLTAAHLLSTNPTLFEVHLFEKAPTLGLDAHSISVFPSSIGVNEQRIDVPMRSFQDGYYQTMIKLYRKLGIRFRRCDFTYSFSLFDTRKQSSGWSTYLLYNGRSGVKGFSLLSSVSQKRFGPQSYVLKFLTFCSMMMANILLFITYIRFILLSMPITRPSFDLTLREWSKYFTPTSSLACWMRLDLSWKLFIDMILVPLFSAVCTAPKELVYEYPVHEILEYVWVTLTSHHYKTECGIRDVVSRLSSNIPYIHTSCSIVSIIPQLAGLGQVSISTTTQEYTGFSHVVIATEATKGSMLLESYLAALPEEKLKHRSFIEQLIICLRTFRYCKAVVINHRDETVLPPDLTFRRDLNLVTRLGRHDEENAADSAVLPISYTMTTHRIFADDIQQTVPTVYQTTNPIVKISEKDTLSTSFMERAVLTVESKKALEQLSVSRKLRSKWWTWGCRDTRTTMLGPLQGAGRLGPQSRDIPGIWMCGSYAYHGIPLLEGCVGSAKDVVEQGILPSEGLNTRVLGLQI